MSKALNELRRMYNTGKSIPCCTTSYHAFKKGEIDYLDIRVHSEWIRYKPKTHRQKQKAKFYTNYSHTFSPYVMEQWKKQK